MYPATLQNIDGSTQAKDNLGNIIFRNKLKTIYLFYSVRDCSNRVVPNNFQFCAIFHNYYFN
jgi:hypothetical protein